LSLMEASICGVPQAFMDYEMNQQLPERLGNREIGMAPHGCYPCRGDDRWVAIAVRSEHEWSALCSVMGNPSWTRQEQFADMTRRWQHQDTLDEHLGKWTILHDASELMEKLQSEGVAVGPVLDSVDLLRDPHLQDRGVLVELTSDKRANQVIMGAPWTIEPGLTPQYRKAPELGEDNDYVFQTLLGMSEAEIARLGEEQVLF